MKILQTIFGLGLKQLDDRKQVAAEISREELKRKLIEEHKTIRFNEALAIAREKKRKHKCNKV